MFLAVALFLVGIQFISMGLLGEIIARTYYESQNKPIYALREVKSHRKEWAIPRNRRGLLDLPTVSLRVPALSMRKNENL